MTMDNIIKLFGEKVLNNKMALEDVPSLYREGVEAYVKKHTNTNTSTAD